MGSQGGYEEIFQTTWIDETTILESTAYGRV